MRGQAQKRNVFSLKLVDDDVVGPSRNGYHSYSCFHTAVLAI
jgi:hypothetical protein